MQAEEACELYLKGGWSGNVAVGQTGLTSQVFVGLEESHSHGMGMLVRTASRMFLIVHGTRMFSGTRLMCGRCGDMLCTGSMKGMCNRG